MVWDAFGAQRLDAALGSTNVCYDILLNEGGGTGWEGHCVLVKPGAMDAFIVGMLWEIWLIPKEGNFE